MAGKILIVDDNEVIRVTLRAILRNAGFEVVAEAKDGDGALAMVERHLPALVCLDVHMPGISGLDVLGRIRESYPATQVLMVTGQSDRDSVQAMIQRGAVGIIVKPFNAARITETVARLMQRRVA